MTFTIKPIVCNHAVICVDTCEDCKTNPKECALYDLYESAGLIKNWDERFIVPTFRERQKRKEK